MHGYGRRTGILKIEIFLLASLVNHINFVYMIDLRSGMENDSTFQFVFDLEKINPIVRESTQANAKVTD